MHYDTHVQKDDVHQGRDEVHAENTGSGSLNSLFPFVSYHTFVTVSAVSLGIMMIMLAIPDMHHPLSVDKGSLPDSITYYADPLAIQVLSLLGVSFVILLSVRKVEASSMRKLATAFILPVLIFGFARVIEQVALKPTFNFDRPAVSLGASVLEKWVRPKEVPTATSCPSGFVLRQVLLLLAALTYSLRENRTKLMKKWYTTEGVCLVVLFVATAFISCSRIWRGFHTGFDVAISIGASCFLFWAFYYVIALIRRRVPTGMTSGITAMSCIFLPVFLSYAGETHWVVLAAIGIFSVMGLANIVGVKEIHLEVER